jgi:hypothetical protein
MDSRLTKLKIISKHLKDYFIQNMVKINFVYRVIEESQSSFNLMVDDYLKFPFNLDQVDIFNNSILARIDIEKLLNCSIYHEKTFLSKNFETFSMHNFHTKEAFIKAINKELELGLSESAVFGELVHNPSISSIVSHIKSNK